MRSLVVWGGGGASTSEAGDVTPMLRLVKRWKLYRFLQNVWRFRTTLAEFHDYDFAATYAIFLASLDILATHIERHDAYVGCEKDVVNIRRTRILYEAYQEAWATPAEDTAWRAFHEHLIEHGRAWWC